MCICQSQSPSLSLPPPLSPGNHKFVFYIHRSAGFEQANVIPGPGYVHILSLQLHHPLCQLDHTLGWSHYQFFIFINIFISVNTTLPQTSFFPEAFTDFLQSRASSVPSSGQSLLHVKDLCQFPPMRFHKGWGGLTRLVSPVAPSTTPGP